MTFCYAELANAGIEKIEISYSGSNDEGWINEIIGSPIGALAPGELHEKIEQAAYDLLEDNWPGWEINEGSEGTITVDVKEQKVLLHHGEHIESTKWHDTEIRS